MTHPRRIQPGPNQESVWDYPRPPALERDDRLVVVTLGGTVVASTNGAIRVLETSHPPGYYLPPSDIRLDRLISEHGGSVCEWKGVATYWSASIASRMERNIGWSYEHPTSDFGAIAGHVSFYPGRVDEITVGGERVRPQAGEFYGGWILDGVVGPFKGEPDTQRW